MQYDPPRAPGLRLVPRRILGLVLGLVAAALLAEVGLRLASPEAVDRAVQERSFGEDHPFNPQAGHVLLDDEIGYRPAGKGVLYGEHGALANDYDLAKPPGRERVLFLGDSVAARGTLTGAIAEALGPEDREWWNAAVTGYATGQALGYFRDHLAAIEPDHVVLVFNYTDYEVTPLVTLDAEGRVHLLNARSSDANAWLLVRSHLYRYLVGRDLAAPGMVGADPSVVAEVEQQLAELDALVRARGARLWVVVTTPMRPLDEWPAAVLADHERSLAALARLGIPAFDTRAAVEATVAAGEDLGQPAGDLMHPSPALSARIAADLVAAGFLTQPE